MLEIGSVIDGKYKILNMIGKGGMSVVYLAMNERANKQWAIKEVRKDGVQNYEVVRQNLIVETDMLKRLDHPHLPSIVDVIDKDDSFLIVMDYIEGNPLNRILKSGGAQPQQDVIEWAKQLCDVLGYLHSRKPPIIYRDMKPSNVMLKPDGNVVLIDFGTAREFKSSSVADTTCLGTRGYAAPEQFGGHGQTDPRTDIYCLGATMYHLVTGHNPATPPYEMYPIRQWNPALSSGLEEIILKCTQLNPNDRYQNCAELMYALENIAFLEESSKKTQNIRWKLFIASAIMTVVLGLSSVGFKLIDTSQRDNLYQSYLTEAQNKEKEEDRENKCKDAIVTIPEKWDAYLALLQTYVDCGLDDYKYIQDSDKDSSSMSVFDSNEYKKFKSISNLPTQEGSEYLTKEFGEKVYYPIAEALLFRTEQNASPRATEAIVWLGKAKNCSLTGEIAQTVNALYDFSKNYQEANTSKENMSFRDYRSYWDQLMKIEELAMNEFQNGSRPSDIMIVSCLNLCVDEIEKKMPYFKSWGNVTEKEMSDFIAKIEDDIKLLTPLLSAYDTGEVHDRFGTLSSSMIGVLKSKFEEVYHGDNATKTEDEQKTS